MSVRLALTVAFGLLGCVPDDSPLMRPGQDCLSCHSGETSPWTIAGTVYGAYDADENAGLEGAEVLVRDREGRELTLRTNPAGNFFTAEPLVFPVEVQVQRDGRRMAMASPVTSGSCNACHSAAPVGGAPGRVAVPGADLKN